MTADISGLGQAFILLVLAAQYAACMALWRRMRVDDLAWSVDLDHVRRGLGLSGAAEILMRTEDNDLFRARSGSYIDAVLDRASHNNVS